MKIRMIGISLACLLAFGVPASPTPPPFDDCAAHFIAYVGANAYQFSPAHDGDLGTVRLFTVLSYQEAAAGRDFGRAVWRLEIRDEMGDLVRTARGSARIDAEGQTVADFFWDGRDEQGRPVPAGLYTYTFRSRYLPDRLAEGRPGLDKIVLRYEDLETEPGAAEAFASSDEVIVNYDLTPATAVSLRQSLAAGSCQTQQNTPIEPEFGYNFYYGSTHSHSNWSDGGHPVTDCSSSKGTGTFDPAAVYDFARHSAGLDYWVINDHNHLFDEALKVNDPPPTEDKVRQRYAAGRAAATAATVDDVFVAIYGMEWGLTDLGHVTLLDTPKLFGWECKAGDCYFDVLTPKNDYPGLYRSSVANPSEAGALGILCHPGTHDFGDFRFNADAVEALQGIAVRSGNAFSKATSCEDANVASADYSRRWKEALNKGFRLGPVADHDSHCNNYGLALPNRTVYLLPNGTAPVLTKPALLQAHKARHFFATEDSNAQLVFATEDGAHVMGDAWDADGPVTLRAAVYDPGNETVSSLEIWRGQVGGGVPTLAYRSVRDQSTLSLTESLSSGTYYYYVHARQADGHDLWSSPMWITYGDTSPDGLDISSWKLVQRQSTRTFTFPADTRIPAGGYVIVARKAKQAAFQRYWLGGGSLADNVVYVNSGDKMPKINGSEDFKLLDASGTLVDGVTIAMRRNGGSTVQRKDPCLPADQRSSWTATASEPNATPGSSATPCGAHKVVINEFSDTPGTGTYFYEFIELYYDD